MPSGRVPLAQLATAGAITLLLMAGLHFGSDALSEARPSPTPAPPGVHQGWLLLAAGSGLCTFDAADSRYYMGLQADPARILGTGPIHFSWTSGTGVVRPTGGYWHEYLVGPGAWVTYGNVVDSGRVLGTGAVTLMLMGTPLTMGQRPYLFSVSARLSGLSGPSQLSGTAAGANLLEASGAVTCGGGAVASPGAVLGPTSRATPSPWPTMTLAPQQQLPTTLLSTATPTCQGDDSEDAADQDDATQSATMCQNLGSGSQSDGDEGSGGGD